MALAQSNVIRSIHDVQRILAKTFGEAARRDDP